MTTQATHTKGPWHTGQGNGEGSIFCESGRMRLESGGTTLYPVCAISRGWDEGEDAANARLIAAAPDLLEALRGLIDQLEAAGIHIPGEDSGQWHGAEGISFSRAIEAITKAEGRAE
jgi:hypothetical protein